MPLPLSREAGKDSSAMGRGVLVASAGTKRLQGYAWTSGYLFAMGATAIWAGNFIVAREFKETIPPVSLAFWRWAVAVVFLLPFALRGFRREWGEVRLHGVYLSITAITGVTLFNTLLYLASHTTTAINLSLIAISFPIFVVMISRFVSNDPITSNKSLGILFVVIGVILLITRGNISNLMSITFAIGDVWMLLASFIFAVYSILVKHKPPRMSIWTFQLSTFVLGLAFLFPAFLWERAVTPSITWTWEMVVSILYVGLFASLSAFVLWNKSIVSIGPSKAGIVYYTLPVFSGALAWLFLDEPVTLVHLASVVLIVCGIVTANYSR